MEPSMSERGAVLIVGDDQATCETLSDFLTSAHHTVHVVTSAPEAITELQNRPYDIVVLDALMAGETGLDLVARIKAVDFRVQVIALMDIGAGEAAVRAISQGASSYLLRPVRLAALLNRVATALHTRSFFRSLQEPVSDPERRPDLVRGLEIAEKLFQFDRELVSILDYHLVVESVLRSALSIAEADMTAFLMIRDRVVSIVVNVKEDSPLASRQAVFERMTSKWDSWGGNSLHLDDVLWSGLEEDAVGSTREASVYPIVVQDVLVGAIGAFATGRRSLDPRADVLVPIIASRAEVVIENAFLHEHTKILATTDPLTGLLNRRVFREGIVREFERSRRLFLNKRPGGDLSVIMLDVDHFKKFNDTYGHQLGDKVLKMVATVLLNVARRATDMVARYGGEEFVVIAPDTTMENARIVAERIRETLQESVIESEAGPLRVTASFGVASYPRCGAETVEELIEQADEALYAAKRKGRNRVEEAASKNESSTPPTQPQ